MSAATFKEKTGLTMDIYSDDDFIRTKVKITGLNKADKDSILSNVSNISDSKTYNHGSVYTGQSSSYKAPVTMNITVKNRGGNAYTLEGNTKVKGTKINVDPAIDGDMWSSEPTDEELEAAIAERGIDRNDAEAVAALKAELSQAKLESMADRLGIDKNDEQAMEDLKNGFYTNSNGQTFAIVNAKTINMMEGSGFQPAAGEIVMVEVSDAIKNDIINQIQASGDRSVIFMGDVINSQDGFVAIKMNTDYSGGYRVGSEEVAQMKNAISNGNLGWVKQNTVINQQIKAAIFGDKDKTLENKADIDLMWNTLEMISSLVEGDMKTFTDKFKSIEPAKREMAINGVAAGINATGFTASKTLANDWKDGVAMVTVSQKKGNAQNSEDAAVLREYLVLALNF